jgi:hypothetical protein
MIATIRWITQDNAASLGYGPDGYADGCWVLEIQDNYEADLYDIPLTRVDVAQREAEAVLGSAPAFWRELPGSYGTAYEAEIN